MINDHSNANTKLFNVSLPPTSLTASCLLVVGYSWVVGYLLLTGYSSLALSTGQPTNILLFTDSAKVIDTRIERLERLENKTPSINSIQNHHQHKNEQHHQTDNDNCHCCFGSCAPPIYRPANLVNVILQSVFHFDVITLTLPPHPSLRLKPPKLFI